MFEDNRIFVLKPQRHNPLHAHNNLKQSLISISPAERNVDNKTLEIQLIAMYYNNRENILKCVESEL